MPSTTVTSFPTPASYPATVEFKLAVALNCPEDFDFANDFISGVSTEIVEHCKDMLDIVVVLAPIVP